MASWSTKFQPAAKNRMPMFLIPRGRTVAAVRVMATESLSMEPLGRKTCSILFAQTGSVCPLRTSSSMRRRKLAGRSRSPQSQSRAKPVLMQQCFLWRWPGDETHCSRYDANPSCGLRPTEAPEGACRPETHLRRGGLSRQASSTNSLKTHNRERATTMPTKSTHGALDCTPTHLAVFCHIPPRLWSAPPANNPLPKCVQGATPDKPLGGLVRVAVPHIGDNAAAPVSDSRPHPPLCSLRAWRVRHASSPSCLVHARQHPRPSGMAPATVR